MAQLLHQFGLNATLLIAQMINFGVLVYVLYRFAYKPILKILDDRRLKIESSLKQAKDIEVRTAKIDQDIAAKLAEAEKRATTLIKEAKDIGEKARQDILDQTSQEVTAMIVSAKADMELAKAKMMTDIKDYIVKTSLLIMEKILAEKLNQQTKEELVLETLKEIRQ